MFYSKKIEVEEKAGFVMDVFEDSNADTEAEKVWKMTSLETSSQEFDTRRPSSISRGGRQVTDNRQNIGNR